MKPRTVRPLALLTVVTFALVVFAPAVPAAKPADPAGADFTYLARPGYLAVSPSTVLPSAVPNCLTNSTAVPSFPTLVCYSPDFLQSAYNFGPLYSSGLKGAGQTIVIVDAYGSPTIRHDLAFFDATFGIPDPPSFTIVCPAGCPNFNAKNAPLDQEGWSIETTLDVEWAHALAPEANIVLVVAPSPAGNSLNLAVGYAVSNYHGAVLSQSYGIPEAALVGNNAQIIQAHNNYVRAAQNAITVLASAGDDGATNGAYPSANALFPSSDPYVTSVGGTQGSSYPYGLATYTGSCGTGYRPGFPGCTPTGYGGETTWNEPWLAISTGGAPSLLYGQPAYQAGVPTGSLMRTTPDISMNAAVNGGVLVYYSATGPRWFVVGGTSASSPEFAALFAIANQARAAAGHGPLGFVNPAIYTLASNGVKYASDFHDITTGDNINAGSTVGYSAGVGYDLATGWGTPDAAKLVADLT